MECEYLSTIRLLTYLLLINYTSAIKKCWKVSVASCCGPLSCGPVWSGKVYPVSEGLNSGNACHYSVQNPCSCDLLFKNMQITTYRIIILPVVLYGLENWGGNVGWEWELGSEELGLRGIIGEWRRLQNEELYGLYSSPNIIRVVKWRRMRLAGRVARMWERRGAYRDLVGKHEGRRPLGRHKGR